MAIPQLSPAARTFLPITLAEKPRRMPIAPIAGRPPRVHLWHIGCQMNDADEEQLAERLAEIGCEPYASLDDADLIILITCTVRQNAEQKVYGKFKELNGWKCERPGRAIAMTGCMAVEYGGALLKQLPDLDYVFDIREADGFLGKLQAVYNNVLTDAVTLPASDRLVGYVPVMGGCNEMCTYCIVPFVRGREQSRPMADIVDHVARMVGRGVREITLLGQNVNSYVDPTGGGTLPELIAAVDTVPGLLRQRFLTSHPRNASPQLFEAMRDVPTACEQLHLPVQAGDDQLLQRMKRMYTVEQYRDILAQARATVPDLSISTDIIVGFCGETEAEFLGTEQLLHDAQFDVVHFQAYSVRPGTAAARRDDDIPLVEKKRRLNHLLDVQRDITIRRNEALIGATVEVMVEKIDETGKRFGRTRQNRVVWIDNASTTIGALLDVTVTAATGWQLTGVPATA